MITVPQGGIVAGRAAQIDISQQPDIAGMIAQAADPVAEKFGQIKAQQRAIQVESTKLEIVKEIGTERQRFDQITDPAQIDAEWPQVEAAIMDKYVNAKGPDGKPLLTPEEADALGLTIKDLSTRHGLALGERAINLTQSQATAAWTAARLDIVNTAATADPDTMEAMLEFGEAAIDQRLAAGVIMPADAATEKAAFRYDVMNARAISAVSKDPDTFLVELEAGDFNDLGAERVAALKVTAQTEINQRLAAEEKAVEAATKTRTDAIGKRLGTIADLAAKGRLVEDEDYLSNPEVQAHPEYAKAKAAIELRKATPGLEQMTVAQLDALIEAEAKRPIKESWQNETLTVLRSMRDKKETAYGTDPKAGAAASGLPVPLLPEFDPASPEAFAAALSEAVSFDGYLREGGYTKRSAVFNTEERTALKAILDPKAEAGPKVALATAIINGTGGNVAPVLNDLEADPVFRRGLKVLSVTGDTALTEAILRGGQKVEAKTAVLPSRKEQILAFDALTGGVFDDAPAVKGEIMEAALALYADSAAGIDGETTGSEGFIIDGEAYTLYGQSVQRLLGAQPDRNGNLTIGGMQEVNGALTVLPPGVSVEDVEANFDRLGQRLMGGVWDTSRGQGEWVYAPDEGVDAPGAAIKSAPTMEARLAPFKGASIYGGVPDFGANPAQRMGAVSLRRVGETEVYELVYERGGRMYAVPEQGKDHAYRFRLKDLMREAAK
jgi:murein DD-endopeptidase MepM/ murein hydrolase activator NlpD